MEAIEIKIRFTKALHKQLVEFGYPELTLEEIEIAYDKIILGGSPEGIIEMWTKGELENLNLV